LPPHGSRYFVAMDLAMLLVNAPLVNSFHDHNISR
jgi:hypothetical protein